MALGFQGPRQGPRHVGQATRLGERHRFRGDQHHIHPCRDSRRGRAWMEPRVGGGPFVLTGPGKANCPPIASSVQNIRGFSRSALVVNYSNPRCGNRQSNLAGSDRWLARPMIPKAIRSPGMYQERAKKPHPLDDGINATAERMMISDPGVDRSTRLENRERCSGSGHGRGLGGRRNRAHLGTEAVPG
jgi:hypothetical protein